MVEAHNSIVRTMAQDLTTPEPTPEPTRDATTEPAPEATPEPTPGAPSPGWFETVFADKFGGIAADKGGAEPKPPPGMAPADAPTCAAPASEPPEATEADAPAAAATSKGGRLRFGLPKGPSVFKPFSMRRGTTSNGSTTSGESNADEEWKRIATGADDLIEVGGSRAAGSGEGADELIEVGGSGAAESGRGAAGERKTEP